MSPGHDATLLLPRSVQRHRTTNGMVTRSAPVPQDGSSCGREPDGAYRRTGAHVEEERDVSAENPVGRAPVKATASPDDLEKLDIRVGRIEAVDDVAKSDKLVRLTVDFGDFKRSILVGMKREREDPSEIQGRQALFVVNLAPRKMMGEVSEGMLFDIGYADGVAPVLAIPEKPVPNGTRAG
jgi:tRNA-binding protein